jgi:hypothetical protein
MIVVTNKIYFLSLSLLTGRDLYTRLQVFNTIPAGGVVEGIFFF